MVSIRPLIMGDFKTIYEWENREELWEVSEQTGSFSEKEIEEFMHRCIDPNNEELERWIVTWKEIPVGAIDLFDFNKASQSCGIGIFIAQPENRGKGIGTKALELVLAEAFEQIIKISCKDKSGFPKSIVTES